MAKVTGVEFGNDGFGISIGGGSDGFNTARSDYRKRLRQYYPNLKRGAEAAGVHPLWAMGAAPNLGSQPVPVGSGQSASFRAKTSRPEESMLDAKMGNYYDALSEKVRLETEKLKQNKGQVSDVATADNTGGLTPGNRVVDFTQAADAEDWENRYGELGGIIGGLINMGADAVHNVDQSFWDRVVDFEIMTRDQVKRFKQKLKRKSAQPKGNRKKPGYYKEMFKGRVPGTYYNPYKRGY